METKPTLSAPPLPTALRRSMGVARTALVALAACSAAPPPPQTGQLDLELPSQWQSDAAKPGHSDAAKPEPPAMVHDCWWQDFGDAELDLAVATALLGNRDLRAALARLETAVETRNIAYGGLLPEADLGFDGSRSRRLFLGFPFGGGGVPSNTVTLFGLNLNLRWELDVWGRIRAGDAAALADLQATAADHAGARLSLIAQTCRAWFAATAAAQQLALAEATVASMRASAEDVRDRFRRGLRPALEVELANTNLANAEATLELRRNLRAATLQQLDLLLGRFPDGRLQTPLTLPETLPPLPAGLPGELLQRRPDLFAAERRLAAAGCRIDAARAALYPRLSLTAGGGTNTLATEDLLDEEFRVWSFGGNLLQPLFRGGALLAEVRRTEARQREALASYGQAVLRAVGEVEQAMRQEQLLTGRRNALARAVTHARRARDLARERWQLGLIDFLAVADAERQVYAAEASWLDLGEQLHANRIDLYLALGGGFHAEASTQP
jgi:outer membrane protein, multidrug efflux system